MKTALSSLLIVFASLSITGCGCSGTWIAADAGHERDVPIGDPVWDPPIEGLGEPGWRDSTEPYGRCEDWRLTSWDVWSDSRGVFAIVTESNPGPTMWPTDNPDDSPEHQMLAFNDGTGWAFHFDRYTSWSSCFPRLTGIPRGPLIIYDYQTYECPWEEGTEAGITLDLFDAWHIHVVNDTLAFALRNGGLLAYWDGVSWGPYPPDPIPYDVHVLWADDTSVFVAGDEGIILSEDEGGWLVHDTHTLEFITTIWGFAGDDVWAGTHSGKLLHWDGEVWENVEWPDAGASDDPYVCDHRGESIEGMWGAEGVLYFHTYTQIASWDGVEFRVIAYWPGEDFTHEEGWHGCRNRLTIRGMWGNSPEEVFFAIEIFEFHEEPCGGEFLLWWDGSEFHWF